MKKLVSCLFIAVCFILTTGCEKRMFGKVQFKGVITDWFTNKPIETKIVVNGIPKGAISNDGSLIGSGTFFNKSDGSFDIECASVKSNNYILRFVSMQEDSIFLFPMEFRKDLELKNRSQKDFSEMFDMPHLFKFKINIKHSKTNKYELTFNSNPSIIIKSDTTIYMSAFFTREIYEASGHKFSITYTVETNPNGSTSKYDNYLTLDINGKDFVEATLNF